LIQKRLAPVCCIATLLAAVLALSAPLPAAAQPGAAVPGDARPAPIDVDLKQALVLLAERNRELQAARRRAEAARADITIAGQRPNPVLSIGASTPFRTEMNRISASGIGTRVEQVFERGNRRELRIAVAEQARLASESDIGEVSRVQRLFAAQALFNLKQAEQRVTVNMDTEAILQRLVDAMELRLKAGDIAPADLNRVRVERQRARNDTLVADADRRQAQADLAFLVGLEADSTRLRSAEPWPAPLAPGALPDAGQMIDARADVRAAQFRLAAAERNRELARSLGTRDVSLSAGVDRSMPESGNSYLSIGIAIPLFAYHRFEGERQRAEADYYAAFDEVARVRAAALIETTRARDALAIAAERSARYRNELLALAERSAAAIEFAYRNGAVGLIDLLDARRTLQATRLEAADAEADHARVLAAWQAVTQAAGESR
jgi:cobalt-zinc-cadmium efflux system outer membrane protein